MQTNAYDLIARARRLVTTGQEIDMASSLVFGIVVITGLIIRRYSRRMSVLGAFITGCVFALGLVAWRPEDVEQQILFMSPFSLDALPFANPFALLPLHEGMGPLVTAAVSIALLVPGSDNRCGPLAAKRRQR